MRKLLLLFSLMLCFILIGANLLAQAPNDNLCNAIPIGIDEACNEAKQIDLVNATIETGEETISPTCTDGDTMLTSTVWFSFVAPAEEIYMLADADDKSVSALAYQMQLFRLDGNCADINNLEHVACNTPPTNILESPAIQTTLTEGETYYIQISGRSFPGLGPFESTGCLKISTVIAPFNDNVCNAIPLVVDDIPQIFTNLGASAEEGEAAIAPPPASDLFGFESGGWAGGTNFLDNSVWFTFTTPAEGGSFNIDLSSSFALAGNFNTQVAVYEATDCNDFSTFNLVGAADNVFPPEGGLISASPNLDLFCLEWNKTYHVAVDGGNSFFFRPIASQGLFSIQVREKVLEPLESRLLVETPTCIGDENGSILVAGIGGAGEYDYRWSTGDSTNNLVGSLAAGTYTLTLTDQCGTQIIEEVEIPASSRETLGLATSVSGGSCEGEEVELNALATGGLPIEEQRVFVQTAVSQQFRGLTKMKLEDINSSQIIAENQTTLFLQFEFVEDQLYATDGDGNLYTINTENGTSQLIDMLGIGFIAGLSYVPTTATLYCINGEGKVYEVDPMTAATNEVLDLSFSTTRATVDLDGNIILLGGDGSWYTSSFDTGTLNNIGFFGENTLPITALEVDPSTGKVYYSVSRILALEAFDQAWQAITELNIATGESIRVLNSFATRFSALAIRASDVAPYQYEWSPAESFENPTMASQSVILETSNTFTVAVTDACETATDEIVVEAFPSVEVTIDTSILKGETYNGIVIEADTTIIETINIGNNCEIRTVNIMVIISSTQQTWATNAIQISPNPTRSILNIRTLGIEEREVEFRILDVHGRTLWQQNRQNLQEEIDMSDFTGGLYFLEIRSAEKFAVRQFVKM